MGLSQSVRNVPTYMRAGAIAQDVFHREPAASRRRALRDPCLRRPAARAAGAPAARAYSKIAPGATTRST